MAVSLRDDICCMGKPNVNHLYNGTLHVIQRPAFCV